jgi:glycosyltransferase involved in cell wall biosynthesis
MNEKNLLFVHPYFLNYYDFQEIYALIDDYNSIVLLPNNKINYKLYKKKVFVKYKLILNKQFYFIPNFKKIINEIKPKIIITSEIFSLISFIVHIYKYKYKYAHVIFSYENTDINKSVWGLFPLTRFFSIINRKSIFVSLSDLCTQNLIKLNIDKNLIIKINPGLFPIRLKNNYKSNKKFKILFIGYLNKNKGIITLINSFESIINDGYNDIFLIIAGKGELEEYIKDKSKQIKNIVYLGFVNENVKLNLFKKCDLFVYPSEDIKFLKIFERWKEQAGASVIEAMRAGIPVIASNSGSLPEIIGRDDVIFEQKNYLQLKEKILWIYKNPNKRKEIGDFNLKRFDEKFNILKNAKTLEEKLEKIIDIN